MAATDSATYNLASAFLAGAWSARELKRRGGLALGREARSLTALVRRLLKTFPDAPHPDDIDRLIAFLNNDRGFARMEGTGIARVFWVSPRMRTHPNWLVPDIATTAALAERLGVTVGQLDWFADRRGMERRGETGPLRHYAYEWRTSRSGKKRLLEVPRPRLKAIQRCILHDILDHILAHNAAHGYRPHRSILTFAEPHVGQRLVMRLDLRDFFPSVNAARVRAIFRTAGYPLEVSCALAGLCTNATPDEVWPAGSDFTSRMRFRTPHLPQGAPTSPALANLCAYRLDCRLSGLAQKLGATYTRYADDLAFSGGEVFANSADRFRTTAGVIALEEGFSINQRKTRLMPASSRQCLAGVVVNERLNGRRGDYDRLEAILFNCVRYGPASQNREGVADFRAHLAGRVAHLARLNAKRGERLRGLLGRIDWGVMQASA